MLKFYQILFLTIGYCIIHLLISQHFKLKDKGMTIHILFTFTLLSIHLLEISDTFIDLQSGGILFLLTLSWFIFFALIDFLVKFQRLAPGIQMDIKNRSLGVLHSLFTSFSSIYVFTSSFFNENYDMRQLSLYQSKIAKITYLFSLSYFIYHSFLCCQLEYNAKGMAQHHILAILSLSYCFHSEVSNYYGLVTILIGQINNPLMHIKTILSKTGFTHTKIYVLVQKVYLYSYILMRSVVFLVICVIPSIIDPNIDIIVTLIMISFLAFNMCIVVPMLKIIKKRKQKELQMKQKIIEYQWFSINEKVVKNLSFYNQQTKQM